MLDRFIENTEPLLIPFTGGKYTIDTAGVIYTNGFFDPLSNNGTTMVALQTTEGLKQVKRSVLVNLVFKRNTLRPKYWPIIDVSHKDGDVKNMHPSNLVWRYPIGAVEVHSFFYSIPGFSRYGIDINGNVYSLCVDQTLSSYTDQMGYRMYGVTPDVGARTIVGMHRLLALAFLKYANSVAVDDVNHIDGNKSNNSLDNLEWVNRKGNCQHAFATGLRPDNHVTLVRNVITDETYEYYSLEECARQLGLDGETVRIRTQSKGTQVYPPGLQFKCKSDGGDWGVVEDLTAALRRPGIRAKLVIKHHSTNLEEVVETYKNAAKKAGCTRSKLAWHITTHGFYKTTDMTFTPYIYQSPLSQ